MASPSLGNLCIVDKNPKLKCSVPGTIKTDIFNYSNPTIKVIMDSQTCSI